MPKNYNSSHYKTSRSSTVKHSESFFFHNKMSKKSIKNIASAVSNTATRDDANILFQTIYANVAVAKGLAATLHSKTLSNSKTPTLWLERQNMETLARDLLDMMWALENFISEIESEISIKSTGQS